MGKLRVLCKSGDTTVSWDERAALANDPDAQEAVRQAERIFNAERAKGSAAFRISRTSTAERIDVFDPEAEQIIMVPPMAGG